MCTSVAHFNTGQSSDFVSTMTRRLFARYLDAYTTRELRFLKKHCSTILQKFYERKGHQKRNVKDFGGRVTVF